MPDNEAIEREYTGVILAIRAPAFLSSENQILDVDQPKEPGDILVRKIDLNVGGERPDVFLRVDDPLYEMHVSALETMSQQARLVHFTVGPRGLVTAWTPTIVGLTVQTNQPPNSNDYIVELDSSARRFVLHYPPDKADEPRYVRLRNILVSAHNARNLVAIACGGNGTAILNVTVANGRPYTPLPACVPTAIGKAKIASVTGPQAADCWNVVAGLQCCTNVNDPCVPFLFFDDGCHMRAELMCKALSQHNPSYQAGKVWIRGNLTRDVYDPAKRTAGWFWHVAAFVIPKGATSKWDFLVLDPMVATTGVTIRAWMALLGDAGARWTLTSQDVYLGVYELDANDDVVESTGRCEGHGVATGALESDDDLRFFQKLLLLKWPKPTYPC